jgi:transcriptional regulator with PAS, ATPase and Fis domain
MSGRVGGEDGQPSPLSRFSSVRLITSDWPGNVRELENAMARKKDGKLPHGGLERVETIAALAMRMRETVRQLS